MKPLRYKSQPLKTTEVTSKNGNFVKCYRQTKAAKHLLNYQQQGTFCVKVLKTKAIKRFLTLQNMFESCSLHEKARTAQNLLQTWRECLETVVYVIFG